MPINLALDFLDLSWFSDDIYVLAFRLLINLFFSLVIIRFIYYPKTRRKDYLFTYFLIGLITFFLCFALKKMDLDLGMGLGLFAIFGIIRYRTTTVEIKEMTYLFIIIGISVINGLSNGELSLMELLFLNVVIALLTFGLEFLWLIKHETKKTIIYEKIELIKPENYNEMLADLQARTGLKINRFEVGNIDFLNDTAEVNIFFFDEDQSYSNYLPKE